MKVFFFIIFLVLFAINVQAAEVAHASYAVSGGPMDGLVVVSRADEGVAVGGGSIYVLNVPSGSAAELSGFNEGDTIVAIGGEEVADIEAFLNLINAPTLSAAIVQVDLVNESGPVSIFLKAAITEGSESVTEPSVSYTVGGRAKGRYQAGVTKKINENRDQKLDIFKEQRIAPYDALLILDIKIFLEVLGPTDETLSKAVTILSKYKSNSIKPGEGIESINKKINELRRADPVDLVKIESELEALAIYEGKLRMLRYRFIEDIKKILNKEEKELFGDFMEGR